MVYKSVENMNLSQDFFFNELLCTYNYK